MKQLLIHNHLLGLQWTGRAARLGESRGGAVPTSRRRRAHSGCYIASVQQRRAALTLYTYTTTNEPHYARPQLARVALKNNIYN